MTAPAATDFGPSWLSSVPDGAVVLGRTTAEGTVVTLFGDAFFSARVKGRRSRAYYQFALVAGDERELLRPGAKFWEVAERVCLSGGRVETVSALAFRRPGVDVAQAAFARDPKAGAR